MLRHPVGVFQKKTKELIESHNGATAILCNCRMRIQAQKKEGLRSAVLLVHPGRKRSQPLWQATNVFDRFRPARFYLTARVFDQIRGESIEHALQSFIEF